MVVVQRGVGNTQSCKAKRGEFCGVKVVVVVVAMQAKILPKSGRHWWCSTSWSTLDVVYSQHGFEIHVYYLIPLRSHDSRDSSKISQQVKKSKYHFCTRRVILKIHTIV